MRAAIGRASLGLAVACSGLGCDREERPWEVVPGPASAQPPSPAPAEEPARKEQLELLAFSFTSAVRSKDPVDRYLAAKPGDRVYAHLTVRNLSGRPRRIHLMFVVNGNERTSLDLEIGHSWSWRTWGYNTLLADDAQGELFLRVTTDDGKTLVEQRLPIERQTRVTQPER